MRSSVAGGDLVDDVETMVVQFVDHALRSSIGMAGNRTVGTTRPTSWFPSGGNAPVGVKMAESIGSPGQRHLVP
jgi:hypothetical protein